MKTPRLRRANIFGNKDADEMWELVDEKTPIAKALSRKNNANSQTNAISNVLKKGRDKGIKRVRVGRGGKLFKIDSEED